MKTKENMKNDIRAMRPVLLLTITQGLSALGSAMTSFALVIWAYSQTGSALNTALLSVCSYVPYILMSIFAGALSDRWNKKKTMLACDAFAAMTTLCVLFLLETGRLEIGHLYAINAINGLMNTVQRPASDVAITLITPKERYQQASAVRSMTGSAVDLLSPVLATALLTGFGLRAVIAADLCTFVCAFVSLALLIDIPKAQSGEGKEPLLHLAGEGLRFLHDHRGVLHLILLFAGINLIASMYNAALPAMVLSVPGGGESALALVPVLTAYIPMMMDTGGNSGSQASVTIIRGLSINDLELKDVFHVMWKEFRVSLCCGICLAAANFVKMMVVDRWMMHNPDVTVAVALVVCATLVCTVACAKLVGCSLPILAEKIGFDPAVMASPFISTIVDSISLLIYFQFATMLLGI